MENNEKLNFDVNEITLKNKVIDDAIETLKSEFVGIDKQIEEIMDNVRTWYLFPNLQNRPLVVAIWGMSGCGKTSLVKRICQLLDIEEDLVYFNFASISENSAWQIEEEIEDKLSNERSNRIFVYDEFQYAATKKMNGEENDNKSGLKPFWELLDTGILHKRSDFYTTRTVFKILYFIGLINNNCPIELKNGVWVNASDCLRGFNGYEINKFQQVFNFDLDKDDIGNNNSDEDEDGPVLDIAHSSPNFKKRPDKLFIREEYIDRLLRLYDSSFNTVVSDTFDAYNKFREMNIDELVEYLTNLYTNAKKGYSLKFNDSIIFVIGNLDEAYEMSYDMNPDMSPDQFKKITEEISVVDIKENLRNRFRNEQIARFGNIHVIYPSFSTQDFKDIISMYLDNYEKDAFEKTGIHFQFDESIKQIIYDEGVFPTQGTRPIFSTIHEIVKCRLPGVVRHIYETGNENNVSYITYKFDDVENKIVAECFDTNNNLVTKTTFNVKLRLKKLRDTVQDDDVQAMCALHESGHFVVYASLFGKMPEKLVSKTTDSKTGGFLMEDYDNSKKKFSKEDKLREIRVLLGGYVAEQMIFGDKMSNGASHDLSHATTIASRMIRDWGFGNQAVVTTYQNHSQANPDGSKVNEDNQNYINAQIKELINSAKNDVYELFSNPEWYDMLKESAQYLMDNSSMPKDKMKEIYDKVSDNLKCTAKINTTYRDMIANM